MIEASGVGRAAIIQAQVMAGPGSDEMKATLFERPLASSPRGVHGHG